ncbi:ankyrin repeat protein (macronuclear) [Tetrahymena thermophila SB210]|uniref:Ankyrin repeat protein n=1 Tax=Tetrahymena thermophila (strain SB210) TaxID=312017 RepID=Q240V0_TETTS|nr:ankyrin repeat protein [Tetrahymena thermophila SB210]EAS02314.2 ankyrin repeat protein [Tetrahymena thermophila SB210]|eukprot:XP_001022559.2 ankyrin repeat protein [Tetrahymena thermophila SB210]
MKQLFQQSGQKNKDCYFLSKASSPQNSNNMQDSAELYYKKNSVELSYLTDRFIDSHQSVNELENTSSNRKKSNTLNITKGSAIDGIITRNSHANIKFPSPSNYVNLSYQKLKLLNANEPKKGYGQDSVVSDKQMKQSNFLNTQKQRQISLCQNANINAQNNQEQKNKNIFIQLDQLNQQSVQSIRDSSIENNKFQDYNQDFNQFMQNELINQKDEQNQQNLLQLQLSPIIRRYTLDAKSQAKAGFSDQYYLNNNFIQPAENLDYKSQRQDVVEKQQNLKQIKKDKLKKVQLSTDHAFHFSSGRAKLKNKRQMFSPCQSARYECKVQFENKYLIKTGFIQPSDKNKDVQMISVDLIQKRRVELIQKLENLQSLKQKIQQDKEDQSQKQLDENSININKITIQQPINVIDGIQEDDKEDSQICINKNQKDQQLFSEKITKLKMLDNFNIKMKGIQNQIKDINQIVSKEDKLAYLANDLNKSTNTLDQTNKSIQGPSFQQSLHNSKFKEISLNNSNQSFNKLNSSNFSRLNSSKSTRKKYKGNQFDLPVCNSNEILKRYNKIQQAQKQANQESQKNELKNNENILQMQNQNFTNQLKTQNEIQKQKIDLSIDSYGKNQDLEIQHLIQNLNNQTDQMQKIDKKYLIIDQVSSKKSPFFAIKDSNQQQQQNDVQVLPKYQLNQQTILDLQSQSSIQEQNLNNQNNLHQQTQSSRTINKQLVEESQDAKNQVSQNEINQKQHNQKQYDKEFLSALLTSWQDKKKETKKPISSGFVKRRIIFQRNQVNVPKKKINKNKIRNSLLLFLQKLKQSKLQLEEFCEKKAEIFMEKPLQRLGSFVFFKAVKHNNLISVKNIISQCRYFIFDFDQKKQTCLHKAAKKGYTDMLEYFISLGADLEFKDIAGRKALYYAIKNNKLPCIKLLLLNMANPWSYDNADYNKLIKDKPEIQKILKIFRKLHLILMFTPYRHKQQLIENTIKQLQYHDLK